jgi:hypothetical protein
MFDKVSQAAEKLASNVSRRAFLGSLGKGAVATAGVLAGMLAFGGKAQAGVFSCSDCPTGSWCCYCGRIGYGTYSCNATPQRGCRCVRV